jgi:endonuclease YncB( thermonuclease family)
MWRPSALWLAVLLVSGASVSEATTSIPVSTLTIKGIYATKPRDSTLYCLLGSGACAVVDDAGRADAFIAQWLANHPTAAALPISDERHPPLMRGMAMPREVFVWIEDSQESLTLALVRQGFYPAAALRDAVEQYQLFRQPLSELNNARTGAFDIPAEYRPHRLVSDADYRDRSNRAVTAEVDAKRRSAGIWSERVPHANDARAAARKSREVFPLEELYVRGIQAHRIGDPDAYCLIGGVACNGHWRMSSLALGEDEFVERWLMSHPRARAVPISGQNYKELREGPMMHSTYIWIEDRQQSLNIDLIRNGFYRADVLEDSVAYDQKNNGQLGVVDDELRRERAETGPPLRFITADDYAARTANAALAEREAERQKRGMWSDARLPL